MNGFLGTKATFARDISLIGSILVAIAFIVGAYLAVKGYYTAHRWVQTGAAGVNLALVFGVMIPSLLNVSPDENLTLPTAAFVAMPAHEVIGTVAMVFGVYVVLVGNKWLPQRWRFTNYKLFMRIAFGLYLAATIIGVAVYVLIHT
ncbi:MAG TPA: hypothetical protein DEF43_07215 [Chloroflexus aurantiacus]|jgi:uncharacterized membrane protein YozB (DUF420 family)|uniref:DUF420 domain-containing protein n=1 Tax=Chloroflexus aurantiacus (strain ATCC 29366 / DSM 635 / J-10-fl) TaxID=324602 RepID=A9WDI2_CHLAA|nr:MULTISPECIES: hypothetical protein [Chloroflexus]ABY37101.1 hypothetical protein Caur_3924 [Chloroflexus aurantiacus J-10-fl]RMG50694.1 MAG: hypothetical protein D6716_07845 [Chloroflexota bacterium]HBW66947.1 hypothetical protein [Chloroflexus aurantiacus]